MFKWLINKVADIVRKQILNIVRVESKECAIETVLMCIGKEDLTAFDLNYMQQIYTIQGELQAFMEKTSRRIQMEWEEDVLKAFIGDMIVETIDSEQFIDNVIGRIKGKQL